MLKQTRKWSFVEQEAKRLNALGVSVREMARKLGVSKTSVIAWRKSGKLPKPGQAGKTKKTATAADPLPRQSPAEMVRAIRAEYRLDAVDDQLLLGAQRMLARSQDLTLPASEQRRSFAEFRATMRQLNLPGRQEPAIPLPSEQPAAPEPVARPRLVPPPAADPRAQRTVVNS